MEGLLSRFYCTGRMWGIWWNLLVASGNESAANLALCRIDFGSLPARMVTTRQLWDGTLRGVTRQHLDMPRCPSCPCQPCSVPSSQFPSVSRQSVKLSCRHEHPCFPIVFHITHHICCLVCNFIMSWQPFWIEAPDLFGQRLFGDRLRCELRPQRIGGLSVANRHDQNREQLICFHRFKTHLDDLRWVSASLVLLCILCSPRLIFCLRICPLIFFWHASAQMWRKPPWYMKRMKWLLKEDNRILGRVGT